MLMTTRATAKFENRRPHSRRAWEGKSPKPARVLASVFSIGVPVKPMNEALACQRELGIDNAKLNVNGGSIAIGHPLGCSGARLATTLIHQMARTGASRGITSLCVGVGQGLATVFERE